MGIVQSTLNKKKEKRIKKIETLNTTIENLKLFKNELECKNTELQNENTILLDNLNNFKSDSEEVINKIKKYGKLLNTLECPICMDNICDNVLLPCGHLFCSNCLNQFTQCPTCRIHILSKRKLYI
jgi:hypothetical protein